MPSPIATTPLTVAPTATAAQGFVLLDHPDGLALTMIADVAAETGRRLIAAAGEAIDQDMMETTMTHEDATPARDPGAGNRGRRAPAAGSGEVRGSGAGAGGGGAEDFDSDSAAGGSAPPAKPNSR